MGAPEGSAHVLMREHLTPPTGLVFQCRRTVVCHPGVSLSVYPAEALLPLFLLCVTACCVTAFLRCCFP